MEDPTEAEVGAIYLSAYESVFSLKAALGNYEHYSYDVTNDFEYDVPLDEIELHLDTLREAAALARRFRTDPRLAPYVDARKKLTEACRLNRSWLDRGGVESARAECDAAHASAPIAEIRADALAACDAAGIAARGVFETECNALFSLWAQKNYAAEADGRARAAAKCKVALATRLATRLAGVEASRKPSYSLHFTAEEIDRMGDVSYKVAENAAQSLHDVMFGKMRDIAEDPFKQAEASEDDYFAEYLSEVENSAVTLLMAVAAARRRHAAMSAAERAAVRAQQCAADLAAEAAAEKLRSEGIYYATMKSVDALIADEAAAEKQFAEYLRTKLGPLSRPLSRPLGAPGDAPGVAPGVAPGEAPGDAPGDAPGVAPGVAPGDAPGDAPETVEL